MKNYRITINGKTYEVGVEECGDGAQVKSVQPAAAPISAPAPAPVPRTPAPKAPEPRAPEPEAPEALKAAQPAGAGDVTAPMPGTVLSVAVSEGQQVKQGQLLLVFEAMKMENELLAPCSGTVKKIHVSKGSALETGMLLISIG